MATVQLNVRIDEDLKAAGDAVLERHGIPAVQVIRNVWRFMADHQRIPDFDQSLSASTDEVNSAACDRVRGQAGMVVRLAKEAGLRAELEAMTYEQLRESAYEEMLVEMGEGRV